MMLKGIILPGGLFKRRLATVELALLVAVAVPGFVRRAAAEQVVSCGGFAMLGGAQINCSHTAPKQPVQFCTFSWALLTDSNVLRVVEGSFLVAPGANNTTVYQGGGFAGAASNPIILCQGKKGR